MEGSGLVRLKESVIEAGEPPNSTVTATGNWLVPTTRCSPLVPVRSNRPYCEKSWRMAASLSEDVSVTAACNSCSTGFPGSPVSRNSPDAMGISVKVPRTWMVASPGCSFTVARLIGRNANRQMAERLSFWFILLKGLSGKMQGLAVFPYCLIS